MPRVQSAAARLDPDSVEAKAGQDRTAIRLGAGAPNVTPFDISVTFTTVSDPAAPAVMAGPETSCTTTWWIVRTADADEIPDEPPVTVSCEIVVASAPWTVITADAPVPSRIVYPGAQP